MSLFRTSSWKGPSLGTLGFPVLACVLPAIFEKSSFGSAWLIVLVTYAEAESWRLASLLVSVVSWVLRSVSTCSRNSGSVRVVRNDHAPTHVVVVPAALRSHALAHFSFGLHRMRNRGITVYMSNRTVAYHRIAASSSYIRYRQSS